VVVLTVICKIVHDWRYLMVKVVELFGCGRVRTVIVWSPPYHLSRKFCVHLYLGCDEQHGEHRLPCLAVKAHVLNLFIGRNQCLSLSDFCVHCETSFVVELLRFGNRFWYSLQWPHHFTTESLYEMHISILLMCICKGISVTMKGNLTSRIEQSD